MLFNKLLIIKGIRVCVAWEYTESRSTPPGPARQRDSGVDLSRVR